MKLPVRMMFTVAVCACVACGGPKASAFAPSRAAHEAQRRGAAAVPSGRPPASVRLFAGGGGDEEGIAIAAPKSIDDNLNVVKFVDDLERFSLEEGKAAETCPVTWAKSALGSRLQPPVVPAEVVTETSAELSAPSFLSALIGIGLAGSPWEYMLKLQAQGYTGVVPINLGPIGVYKFLLSPSSVRSATVEQASALPRRFSVPLFETLELDRGIVYEQGERHKRNKRLCIPSFEQYQSMEIFVGATRDELDAVRDRFDGIASSEGTLDLYAEMRRATLNVVLAVTFGLGRAGASEFDRAEDLSKTIGDYLACIVSLANEIPPLWQISPRLSPTYVRVTDSLLPNLRELVAEVIATRRKLEEKKDASSSSIAGDLLSVLIAQGDLSDESIQSILFDMVIAGSDTAASTTTAAMYVLHLPDNKEWLEKGRNEATAKNGGDSIPLSDLRKELPVATSIAKEILRLYPPVPFVGRTATENSYIEEKYEVEVGDTFCFSPWFLGRDPTAWGIYHDKFNPQLWIDEPTNGGAPTSFSWLPFGAGPRGCLGTRLGLTEVTLGISRLLRDYDLSFKQSGPLPVKYDLTLNLEGVMKCNIRHR